MKLQIRKNVFETNSSSTHNLTLCLAETWNKWESGELFYCDSIYGKNNMTFIDKYFVKAEEVDEYIKSKVSYWKGFNTDMWDEESLKLLEEDGFYSIDELLRDYDFYSFEYYFDEDYLECFDESYTAPNGVEVVAFGKYGYEG